MITLEYKKRDMAEKLPVLRKKGSIPAVFYGKKEASTPISLSMTEFVKVWKKAGESDVVTLKTDGHTVDVLIHEVVTNPLTGIPLHADFYVFEKGKKIEIEVPLEFEGVSPAMKDLGGNLIKVMHEIKIKSSPEHIPHSISVDISTLATFEDVIFAKDIKLPTGVELEQEPDDVVASIAAPRVAEVDEPSASIDLSAIEVEKKGKKEEEGGEVAE